MWSFPEDRAPETDDGRVVRIRMDRLTVMNVRNWGEVWLGRELWDKLGLDGFWTSRLGPSRKGTDWLANTAVEELIGPGAITGRSTLYSCLDRVTGSGDRPRMGNFNAGQRGQAPCGHFPSASREDLSMGGES